MFSRREILKLGFLSTLGLSFDAFSVVRDLKILDFKEDDEKLEYTLVIRKEKVKVGSREGTGVLVNGQLPGPLLTFKEGKEVIIHVINEMDEPTSIHWHGILVPNNMDGVPGLVFPGIMPKSKFTYRFPVVPFTFFNARTNRFVWTHYM